MLNWDEFNEVENTEKTKQVPQEVVKEAVKQTAQETEEPVSSEAVSSVQAGDRAQLAKEAIENLDGSAISGRNVTVNEARPRAPRGGGSGGGRGGGGGYGGGGRGGDRGGRY